MKPSYYCTIVVSLSLITSGCAKLAGEAAAPTAPAPTPPPSTNAAPPRVAISPGPKAAPRHGAEPPEPNYAKVLVFYGTDRRYVPSAEPSRTYSSEQGTLQYGTCEVSIPRDHKMGTIERPSMLKLQFREDPEKHIVLLSTSPMSREAYVSQLSTRIDGSSGKCAFVFIHGYNTTFEDAAQRTAQLSYDLAFEGAPIFYSWPSQGKLTGYHADEDAVVATTTNLVHFLKDIATQTTATNILLIAHSMGNRALTAAFTSICNDEQAIRSKFKELILTAPDIDAEVFRTQIAPGILGEIPAVTLYASSADRALVASKAYHGNKARAGDSGEGLVVLPSMETIDATAVDTSFMGHAYFAEERTLLSDLFYLVRDGSPADKRFSLIGADCPSGHYWKFKP